MSRGRLPARPAELRWRTSRPRGRAPTRSCGACSSRAPTPTGLAAEAAGLDAARPRPGDDARLRRRSAAGDARPRGRLASAAPSDEPRPAGAGRAAPRAAPAAVSRRVRRARCRQRQRRAGQATAPGGRRLVNAVLVARPARARAARLSSTTPPPRCGAALGPALAGRAVVGRAGRRPGPRVAGRSQRARRVCAPGQHAGERRRRASRPSWRCRRVPPPAARGPRPRRPVRRPGLGALGAGAIMPQSRASMLVARVLAPQPGARVLDLCAAPGAKTTHLGGVDGGPRRAGRGRASPRPRAGARETCRACSVGGHGWRSADAAGPTGRLRPVLVDPPCSGLGTLQSRPDLRWRTSPERIASWPRFRRRSLRPARRRPARRSARLLRVHDLAGRGRGRRSLLRERTDFSAEALSASYPTRARFLQTAPIPRWDRRLLRRPAAAHVYRDEAR